MASDTPTPERGASVLRAFDYFHGEVPSAQRDALRDEFDYEDRSIGHDAMLGEIAALRADLSNMANAQRQYQARVRELEDECARKDAEIAAVTERSQYNAWKVGVLTHTLRVASPIHTLMSVDDMAARYNLKPFNPGAPRDGE